MPQDLSELGTKPPTTRKHIKAKLMAIQKDIPTLVKSGKNESQGYKFLSDAQLIETLNPLFEKHGVVASFSHQVMGEKPTPSQKQTLTTVSVAYEFFDLDSGESDQGVVVGQGTDTGDKGVYKAITGAIKYLYVKQFMIATGDDAEYDIMSKERGSKPQFNKDVLKAKEGNNEED